MSSVELSDPHISMAYDALVHNDPLRWFLLAYGNKPNELSLCASGTGDVDELRSHLTIGNICYGIFRERTQDKSLHVAVSYIPDSVKGVWRARALVHAKAVSSKFKAPQVFNASDPEQVTIQALRNALRLPPRNPLSASTDASSGLGIPRSFSISRKPSSGMRSASLFTPPNPIESSSPTEKGHARSASGPLKSSSPSNASPPPSSESEQPPPNPGRISPSIFAAPSPIRKPSPSPLTTITTSDQPDSMPSVRPGPSSTRKPPPSALVTTIADQPKSILKPSPLASPLPDSPISIPPSSESSFGNSIPMAQSPHSPLHASWLAKQESPLPPPPPPKSHTDSRDDEGVPKGSRYERSASPYMESIPDSQSVASHHSSDRAPSPQPLRLPLSQPSANGSSRRPPEHKSEPTIDGLPGPSFSSPFSSSLASPPRTAAQEEVLRSRSKWAAQADAAETLATQEAPPEPPAPKKARSRFQERAVSGGGASEEEERKLAVLDEERRRRAVERTRREKEEREEEAVREREFEERKEREKKRRLESAKKAEERRVEQKRQQEEDERRRKEEKERKEEEIRQRRNHIQKRFENQDAMDLLSGFITLESSSHWKRRYYRLSTEDWVFFKSDKEVTQPMHAIELSRVRALREWHEGYDELEAIPHSFAVELKDEGPWLFFADSAEDKEILLGLLNQAAGL